MMETSPSGRPLPLPENPLLRLTPPFRDPISRPPISPQRKDAEMTIATGDKLPQATLVKVTDTGPEQVNAADYFKGRKVALFSVPGAFPPTCSAKHDRNSVVSGKRVSVRVDLGGWRRVKKKKK